MLKILNSPLKGIRLIHFKIINIAIFFFFISCVTPLLSRKEVHNNIEILYGSISLEQLYFDYPKWKNIESQYQPDNSVIHQLKKIDENYKVIVFLGTWCSDSKHEVPLFYKVLKNAKINNKLDIQLWAVDQEKHLNNNLPQENEIELIPTFIFYKNDHEIGRIIETPDNSMEQDILNILIKGKNESK